MIQIAQRKIGKNNKTHTISLPLLWIRSNGLQYGDNINFFLEEGKPKALLIIQATKNGTD